MSEECMECNGAYIICLDPEGTIYQCPRCGNKTDQWGKNINDRQS